MAFLIYEYSDYKKIIRERLKELKKSKPKFTLQYLSEVLQIQYTFLSKVLNSDSHHLSEDQIFSVGYTLEFLDDEVEYLLLLRAHAATANKARKDFLFQKISTLQKKRNLSLNTVEKPSSQFADDITYLMNYQAVLVHVSLWIKTLQKNPNQLASLLGLDLARLKEILALLDRLNRIEYDVKANEVKKVTSPRIHFGSDHPLMRTHQLVMKTAMNQMSFAKNEEKKDNIFVTFTTDNDGFDKIKQLVKNFMGEVQKVAVDSKHTGLYQLNVDFLELFNLK